MTIQSTSSPSTPTSSVKGFTLTEIAIVLGIIGLILGAIWVAASGVYSNQKLTKANSEILSIVQSIRTLYATSASTGVSTATDLTSTLIAAGAVPSDMVNTTTTLFDPWSGGATGVLTPSTADGFTVIMTNVPQAACISLISTIAGTGRDTTLYAAQAVSNSAISTTDVLPTDTALTTSATPASANSAISGNVGGCNGTGPFKMKFGFSLK